MRVAFCVYIPPGAPFHLFPWCLRFESSSETLRFQLNHYRTYASGSFQCPSFYNTCITKRGQNCGHQNGQRGFACHSNAEMPVSSVVTGHLFPHSGFGSSIRNSVLGQAPAFTANAPCPAPEYLNRTDQLAIVYKCDHQWEESFFALLR